MRKFLPEAWTPKRMVFHGAWSPEVSRPCSPSVTWDVKKFVSIYFNMALNVWEYVTVSSLEIELTLVEMPLLGFVVREVDNSTKQIH